MAETSDQVTIYTDGGCNPNPGVGGWAAVLVYEHREKELTGGAPNTTNNRMEMTAAIEALATLKRPCKVAMVTDSQYLQKGITEWLPNWKRRNWQRKGGPVKNQDLWQKLDKALYQHQVTWRWVRGHVGDYYNERCDKLASEAIRNERKR